MGGINRPQVIGLSHWVCHIRETCGGKLQRIPCVGWSCGMIDILHIFTGDQGGYSQQRDSTLVIPCYPIIDHGDLFCIILLRGICGSSRYATTCGWPGRTGRGEVGGVDRCCNDAAAGRPLPSSWTKVNMCLVGSEHVRITWKYITYVSYVCMSVIICLYCIITCMMFMCWRTRQLFYLSLCYPILSYPILCLSIYPFLSLYNFKICSHPYPLLCTIESILIHSFPFLSILIYLYKYIY